MAATALALAPATSAQAAPAGLKELYAAAVQGNPTLRMRELEIERARAEADIVRSRLGLQVQAAAAASLNDFRDGVSGSHGYGGQRASLNARYPLYDPATGARVGASEGTVLQREQEAAAARSSLAGELLDRYLQALAAQDEMEAVAAETSAAARHVERLRAMRERQMARVNDLAEAQAYAQTLVTRAVDARNERALALARLRELSGVDADAVHALRRASVAPVDAGASLAGWLDAALAGHPRLQALRQAVEAARRQVDAARAEGAPQLAATASHTWSDQGYDNRRQPSYRATSLGLEFRMPLWDAGRGDAAVREALARQGAAEQALEEARRAIDREIRTHWLSAEANLARIASTGAEVDAFDQTVVAQERALELGAARVTDVLDARRRLLRARSDQAKARYDHLRDLAALRLRARPLAPADIDEWAAWFEPAR